MNKVAAVLFFWCGLVWTSAFAATPNAATPRLVVLAPNLVELLYSIGAGEQIVGTVEFADYPAAAKQLPRMGNFQGIQLEKILAAKPDLVLYWRSGTKPQDIASLTQLGIKTIGFEPQQPADIAGMLQQLGELTGHTQRAHELANDTVKRLDALKVYQQKTSVAVFYEIWHQPLTSIGSNDWPTQALRLCGAHNLPTLATAYPQVSIERLVATPPQLIILPSSVNEPRQHFAYQQWPALATLPQLDVDADLLHRATLRTIDGIEQLCQGIDRYRQSH